MKMDKVAGSGNDEYMTPCYAIEPLLKYLKPFHTVWCPFDIERSNFVKMLREEGHEVIHTHIDEGKDFFTQNIDCDVIVSNPPYSCLTPEHEVLTKDGWRSIVDVNVGDEVLSVDYNSLEISYDKVRRTIKKYTKETILRFETKYLSQAVTADHRMFAFSDYNNKLRLQTNGDIIEAKDVIDSDYMPRCGYSWKAKDAPSNTYLIPGTYVSNGHIDIWHNTIAVDFVSWVRFLGLWLADGCTRHTNNTNNKPRYTVSIKQGEKGYDEVRDILSKLPFRVKEYINKNHTTNFEIHNKQLWEHLQQFGDSYTKFIPDYIKNAPPSIIKIFMDAYGFGDSFIHKTKSSSYTCYSTMSRELADDIQECVLKLGRMVNICSCPTKSGSIVYRLLVNDGSGVGASKAHYKTPMYCGYTGYVHCLSLTNNSVFLVRHNGKISFTGNCKTEILERLFELDKPFAMLVGVVGLFESQRRFNMFKDNKFEIMYINKRVSYLRSYDDKRPAFNPPFSSVYVCHNVLPQQIVFETIDNRRI